MSRIVTVGAAQTGPIQETDSRNEVVERLINLLREGSRAGCDLVVFPELALTTFFPRCYVDDKKEFDHYFEKEMPSPETKPLFDEAKRLGVGFHLGYAELTPKGEHFNTSVLVDKAGDIIAHYRKVHLPGHEEHEPWRAFQHLERYYFDPGPGFEVHAAFGGIMGMAICNDRRWPETYRVLSLQGLRNGTYWLQHTCTLCARSESRSSTRIPQPFSFTGRRLSEWHVGGRRS